MLEKMEQLEISVARLNEVVGVTSHDRVYFRSVINIDCVPSEPPFGGTPLKKKGILTQTCNLDSPINESDLILKLSGMNLSKQNNRVQEENISSKEKFPPKPCDAKGFIKKFDYILQPDLDLVNRLTSDGKIEESLLHLLNLLDKRELKSAQKLKVHKMIASRAICFLKWNKDLQQDNA